MRHRLGVGVEIGDDLVGVAGDEGEDDLGVCLRVGVVALVLGEGGEGVELLREGRDGVHDLPGPERALVECYDVEACDDAEVVGAALEGTVEVGIFTVVGIGDGAVGKHNLVLQDVVGGEAVQRSKEGFAA